LDIRERGSNARTQKVTKLGTSQFVLTKYHWGNEIKEERIYTGSIHGKDEKLKQYFRWKG
jgi:hypothetical protein